MVGATRAVTEEQLGVNRAALEFGVPLKDRIAGRGTTTGRVLINFRYGTWEDERGVPERCWGWEEGTVVTAWSLMDGGVVFVVDGPGYRFVKGINFKPYYEVFKAYFDGHFWFKGQTSADI